MCLVLEIKRFVIMVNVLKFKNISCLSKRPRQTTQTDQGLLFAILTSVL